MAETSNEKRVVILSDPTALAEAVASRFLSRIAKRSDHKRLVHISLTGGSMGGAVLKAAAANPRAASLDWSKVHFWWSDERWVPRAHDDRNENQSREALLDQLDIPAENIHSVAASDEGLDLDAAARLYEHELAKFSSDFGAWPSFDVCFLGVGPDGHIASLFPDRPEIHVTDRAVLPVRESPKPPPERVTMTRPVINASRRLWMVLAGTDKASALGLALAGASYGSVPAAGAKGRKRTVFFVDEAAAANVPPELIDREY
ncbi:6-phosphogluconolactonase [Microbacterium sp.]|uniref:6-phosphogluconolactonase n=1 Tax=Microbacterium sp. TaxID=51671 RepID=UPI002D78DB9F|nr:6-phosphogluconolactonase [Microbacterium sp.]HET6302716.1 6-phosphogluconolactonase [Microbacterium sp.]